MPRRKIQSQEEKLRRELEEVKIKLSETEDTLNAIRSGAVDAIVVSGENGDKIFSIASSETPYRIVLENIDEGAVTISASGTILYCNRRFTEIIDSAPERIIGTDLEKFISDRDVPELKRLFRIAVLQAVRGELSLVSSGKTIRLSLSPLPSNIEGDICMIVSDITDISKYQNYLREMVEERTSELRIANMHLFADLEKLRTAEKALLESERLFRFAFDDGAVPMTMTSKEGGFLKVNRAFCRLTGYNEDELLKMSFQQITHPEDLPAILRGRNEIKKNERTYFRLEKRYIKKDGLPVWVSISTAPVRDESGTWDFFVTHIVNINKRKIAETRLKESKERFRQLANSIPQLAWIARSDGYIFWFNQRWFEYTGKTPEEMTGWGWQSVLHPDAVQFVLEKWKTDIKAGRSSEMVNLLLGKDGQYREFLTKSIPIFSENGVIEQWFGTHTDISVLRRIEDELMISREKLNIALENGQTGTWEWDLITNNMILDERTEKMFGLEPGSFEGTYYAFENNIHEEDLQHLRKAISRTLKTGEQFETIYRTKPKNGESSFINAKALVNTDSKGKVISMSGVCFDVTGMKRGAEQALIKLNEELLRSNTDLQQFAYVASHDLQEPLRMVSSFTQLLEQKYADKVGKEGLEYIHFAVEGSKRMYELLNGLLAYSRVQSRGRDFAKVDMNRVIDKVLENLSLVIAENGAVIHRSELPQITGDENQMIQLIQNLFENSIKFRRNIPEISISCEIKEDLHIFSIKDQGIGIEQQYHERIFRIFQRLHRTDEYEGTGIGLAICKRIVERHGGKIWVESEYGISRTFFFSIPGPVSPGTYPAYSNIN